MRALVTGANGFLGSWLIRSLRDQGHEVSVLLRKQKDGQKFEESGFKVFYGDVTHRESLNLALQGQQQVYHLAGLVAYSRRERDALFKINADGTENVLLAAAQVGIQRVLLSSSVVAVGASFYPEVLTEESPYQLMDYHFGYHESKRRAEALLCQYVREGKVDGVIVNPSTVYGAGDAAKSSRSTQLQVARGQMRFYPPGGVSVVAVEDVIDGMLKAMQKGRSGERYILAGENMTLRELFSKIATAANVHQTRIPLPGCFFKSVAHLDEMLGLIGLKGPLPSERAWVAMMYHWYDSSKARRELGFTSRPAQQAIANSVAWMAEQGLLRK